MSDLRAHHRLAIYGTLAPGRVNHHHVSMIDATWVKGVVRGYLSDDGWGATYGFPGIRLDPEGDAVEVQVLESADLPDHWTRLDAFEGEEYERVPVDVETEGGVIKAQIYVVAGGSS
ncbi:MAG: gamma-glutamylcyclotransferase family protein [Pseudomonadota bacterium]